MVLQFSCDGTMGISFPFLEVLVRLNVGGRVIDAKIAAKNDEQTAGGPYA